MNARSLVVAAMLLTGAGLARADDSPPNSADAREAVRRSLPFLEREGVAWMKERACVTCHHTSFLVWTHGEARRRGFAVDAEKIVSWTDWALLQVLSLSDSDGDNGADTLSQLLLGRDPASPWFEKPSRGYGRVSDPYENVLKHLLAAQTEDGRWVAGGQSGNPDELPTAWAVLALASRDEFVRADRPGTEGLRSNLGELETLMAVNDEALPKARDKALEWLRTREPGRPEDLNERLVLRLLIARRFGTPRETGERLKELLARQNADGGFSADPKLRRPSDAFATGQALYALSLAGTGADQESAAIDRAVRFLTTSQREGGSWFVPTGAFHPPGERPREKEIEAVYTYWGTAWATLGLLHALPVRIDADPGKDE